MKKSILLAVIFSCALNMYAYDFKVANEDGCEIAYNINSDGTTVSVTYTDAAATKRHLSNYADFLCDTMRIPESITYEGKQYPVTGLDSMCFKYINKDIKVLMLPATIDSIIFYNEVGIDHFADAGAFYGNSFHSIIMADNNPKYTTEEGILYSKDKTVLLAYPAGNLCDSVFIKEGVVMLGHGALVWARNIRYLELPLTLKELGEESLSDVDSLTHLVIKDSVERIGDWALDCKYLMHLTLGSGLKSVGVDFFVPQHRENIDIYLRAANPPLVYNLKSNTTFLSLCHVDRTKIYVPAQSVNAYRQADGWNRFTNIVSIEPPVVSGIDNVQVSWVQNFSATGYVWTLYTDEAHTQRYMTLTFDANGHLIGIDLAGNQAPARVPALYEEDEEESTQFAEYYSFTITGLSQNTSYYFVRQSLNGTDVIDEESGTFATQSNTTALDNINGAGTPTKVINNGCILIMQGDKTYTITGAEIR